MHCEFGCSICFAGNDNDRSIEPDISRQTFPGEKDCLFDTAGFNDAFALAF